MPTGSGKIAENRREIRKVSGAACLGSGVP